MKRKILVTGGAGYIGSFTCRALKEKGYQVIIFDDLKYGHREAVSGMELIKGNLVADRSLLNRTFQKEKIDGVIHFAAYALAGESMEKPADYFENNVLGSLYLLEAMRQNGVKAIVFSSTCAIYGQPEKLPIKEDKPKKPESPYGESKLMVEKLLSWYDEIYQIKSVCLRYFNAAGAVLDGSFGEDHDPETHLIPLVCQAALGQRKKFMIFGDDYRTPDGTCIRDYIHVLDLAAVHLLALEKLFKKGESNQYNVGTGQGHSVKEVVAMVKKVSGKKFPVEIGPRRPGDPDQIFAHTEKIRKELSWHPKHSDLKTIIQSAWRWHQSHPRGFKS